MSVEDKNSAVETVSREKATTDPGSVGAPMSGVVVEVRVKEGQEIKKGDPVCGQYTYLNFACRFNKFFLFSHECYEDGVCNHSPGFWSREAGGCPRRFVVLSVSFRNKPNNHDPSSKGDSINQGDLTVEIVH